MSKSRSDKFIKSFDGEDDPPLPLPAVKRPQLVVNKNGMESKRLPPDFEPSEMNLLHDKPQKKLPEVLSDTFLENRRYRHIKPKRKERHKTQSPQT